jgi:hopanoid biosynthesis associated RND transporter like protein HpnN
MSSRGDARLRSLVSWVVGACTRRAWLVIVAAAIACAGALVYTERHIAIDTDSAKLISEDVPWRKREAAFTAAFPQRADLIAVVVDGATPELAESATAALSQQLSAQSAMFRDVWRPDGGPFFDRAGLLFESTAEVSQTTTQLIAAQPLLGTLAADPSLRGLMQALSLVLEGARRDPSALDAFAPPMAKLADAFEGIVAGKAPPFSWRSLIAQRDPEARELRRFILVHPLLDYTALQPGGAATDAIRHTVHALALDADPRLRIRLTGDVPLADEEFETLADRAALNAAVTICAVVLLLWLALRSWKLIVAIVSSLTVGLLITASFGLLVFGKFNLISVAFAVLFVGLGVDFGIQFCVCYRAKRYAGDELASALRDAGAEVGIALALAAASTAAGFYAFLPTEYRGVSELGVIAGTGMIVAFVSSITLLPAIIAVLRPSAERAPIGYAAFAPLDRFVALHRRWVLAGACVAAVSSAALLPALQFDFNPLHLRSERTESVATLLDLMRDPNTTPYTVDVLAPSLAQARALAQPLELLPEVDHALTLASFVPEKQEVKLALISDAALLLDPVLNPAEVRPPPNDEETARSLSAMAQRLDEAAATNPRAAAGEATRLARALRAVTQGEPAQRERARDVLIPGLTVTLAQLRLALQAAPVTLETLPADLVRDWVAADGRARIEVFPKGGANDNDALRRFVAAVQRLAPDATGAPVSIQESSYTIMRAFIQAGFWALASIALLLAMTLRRAVDVLLTLTPLILAALVTLGICAAIGMPLNFENIIALPLLIGIGVAFNIYFVMAWRSGAVNLLQSSLTRAVLFSALTTGTAFGSLWLSHHPGTSSMGKLLALSLACTLLVALLFLPALLGSVRARSGPPRP